ncbi:MAG: hypothetical protein RL259_684 [Bacteroidota bacterium]|jgi:hypothetical protein
MTQKSTRFIIISAINTLLYSVIIYFMEVTMEPLRFVLQALFFGFFMGFMQVFGLPYINRNKKQ